MEQKIIKVYYDENGLPYQDLALTKPYSIVGSDFTGANNATEVHFYVANIDDTYTWVANIKLQDGTMTYRLLTSATDEESEPYKLLVLDNGITAKKGFIYVGLNGYGGETLIEEVEGVLTINGNPIIVATGTISIALNYNPVVIPLGTSVEPTEMQQILANLSQKLEQDDLDTALGAYLPLAGGTMSGAIVQPVSPVADNDLANKKYVDDEVAPVAEDIADILDGSLTVHQAYHAEMDFSGRNLVDLAGISDLELKQSISEKNQVNGYVGLDSNAKIPTAYIPDSILGQLEYKGTYDCSSGVRPTPIGLEKGWYYIVSIGGIIDGVVFEIGDWLVYNGLTWDKIDNSNDVDTELNVYSKNPVENKVIAQKMVEDNSVKPNTLDGSKDFSFNVRNILDGTFTYQDDKYLQGGSAISSPGSSYEEEYIWVEEGERIFSYIPLPAAGECYDENKVFVSSLSHPNNTTPGFLTFKGTTTIFNGGYYVRLNVRKANKGEEKAIIVKNYTNYSKVLNWLKILPTQIDNTPLNEKVNVANTSDGTPIVPFIRNHMWMKNGSLFTSSNIYGSTQTIPLDGASSIVVFPLYKRGEEGNVGNGSFVNVNGDFVANIDNGAVWDEDNITFSVNVPSGAYGIQLNCILFVNANTYTQDVFSGNLNKSREIYVTKQNVKITFTWLGGLEMVIQDGTIGLDKLTSEVRELLETPYEDTYEYWDSLKKPFDLDGNYLVAFGDSITAGVANNGSGNINAEANSYINLFASRFNMNLDNQATSGACITHGMNEVTAICDKVDAYTFRNDSDEFIIIAGGTNDFNSDAPLGQLGDTATTTFYEALDHICQRLHNVAPNSTVIFITPINVNTTYFPRKTDMTLTLNKYRNAIWEVATKYGLNVVDGSTIGFASKVNTAWGNLMIVPNDGTHPSTAGHALYFRGLCGKLK